MSITMTGYKSYWELAKEGILCDLTLVEKPKQGECKEYVVHKLVMYTASKFFKALSDQQNMEDSSTARVTIETESNRTGLLSIVIEAMYATSERAEHLYYNFTGEHKLKDVMQVYLICDYLQLDEHMRYLQKAISEFVEIGDITVWWREREEQGLLVPPNIEDIVQRHLRANIKYISAVNQTYISVDALLCLWPNIDDPITKSVREFLVELSKSVAKGTGDDSDNSDDEEFVEIIPASEDHPELYEYDRETNCWIDPVSKYIFTQRREKEWYIINKLDSNPVRTTELTMEDAINIRGKGWKIHRLIADSLQRLARYD